MDSLYVQLKVVYFVFIVINMFFLLINDGSYAMRSRTLVGLKRRLLVILAGPLSPVVYIFYRRKDKSRRGHYVTRTEEN